MDNLKSLLVQYDQKRTREINEASERRKELYDKFPDYEKLENDISNMSIKLIQSTLQAENKVEIDKNRKNVEELRNKRDKFLKEHNIDKSYLLPHYECNKCKDTGYEQTPNGSILCSCIKQELYNLQYNNSNIYDLKSQNFDNFSLDVYSNVASVDKYHKKASPRKNMEYIKKTCMNFIENFDNPDENNLLFCGSPGLGKTFLSSCIANEFIKRGRTVLYQTAPIMLDSIIDYKFGKTKDNILNIIYSVDLLIIDDLGTESPNNLKITELFNIINSRLLNQNNKITKTIISTNLSLQELYDTYEERIVSRLIGNYNACYFYGDDIRMKRKLAV